MHRCVISTMFGSCFWFFEKNFSFQTIISPPLSPWSFAFPTPILYSVNPLSSGPSHFSLWFFNPSSPPHSVFHIFDSGSLTCRSPHLVLHISHSNFLTFRFRFLRTQQEQKNRWFLSFQQPCQADGFRGRTATSLADSLTLSLF